MASSSSRSQVYHVWFSTKGRKDVLHEEIRTLVLAEFARIAQACSIRLLALEATFDHVHLLVDLLPDQSLASVIHDLKGATARTVFITYPELRLDMHSNSFWQKSYGSRLVPPNQISAVRRYIHTQDERPPRHE
jgi:putative transposase